MSYARQILDTYTRTLHADGDLLAAAIDAISDGAQACQTDTDADLSEQNLAEMVTCIRLCLNCTDVCAATGAGTQPPSWIRPRSHQAAAAILHRHLQKLRRRSKQHAAHMPHCRICAEACRRCEQACRDLLNTLK